MNNQIWDIILQVPGVAGFDGGRWAFLSRNPGLRVTSARGGKLRVRASLRLAAGYRAADVASGIRAALAESPLDVAQVDLAFTHFNLPRGRAV